MVEGATLMSSGALMGERFRVIRELGRGGAGTVFLAEDLKLKRRVALKLYHRRGTDEQARLVHEAQVAAQFEHAGVIRILDVDLELGAIVMECVHGGSLKSMIARGESNLAQCRKTLLSVCVTLEHIHGKGWVHRDIKPSNILLRRTGEPVITDFGIARKEGDSQAAQGTIGEGSMGFMSPEQALPGEILRSADVFSLGASAAQLFRSIDEELPAELAEPFGRAMAQEASERVELPELASVLMEQQ